jgi:hypothetical protein
MISFLSLKTYNYQKPLGREVTSDLTGLRCRVLGTSFLAILRFGASPIPSTLCLQQVVSLSDSSSVSPVELTDERGGDEWGRSQIKRRRESLVLNKSFITLCIGLLGTTKSLMTLPGLWIRIRIGSVFNQVCGSGSVFGIRIRIQEGKNDPKK